MERSLLLYFVVVVLRGDVIVRLVRTIGVLPGKP